MEEQKLAPIQPYENAPPPSPIKERDCHCGCGFRFIPKRRDQIYLNRQHANYGYNHGERKKKARAEVMMQKILRINDKILEKHFKASPNKEVICFLTVLKSEGFNSSKYTGYQLENNVGYYYAYNYKFHIYMEAGGQNLIKIQKV